MTTSTGGPSGSDAVQRQMSRLGELQSASDTVGREGNAWGSLLEVCMEITSADAAFILDDRGLLLASVGTVDADEATDVGSRIIEAMDQLGRARTLGDDVESLSVMYAPRKVWLTGMRIAGRADDSYTIGVVGALPLVKRMRQAIREAFEKLL